MENESLGVPPSEENGNIPLETPSEITPEATPAPEEKVAEPATSEVELFELPDGRKVDGAGVLNEYMNLQKDYTHKSQELAKVNKPELPEPAKSPLTDPTYVPQTYEELAEQIEARTLAKIEAKAQAQVDAQTAIENSVATQLDEVKKIDPNINENALFLHATKYGFRDLRPAYQNMKDFSEQAKKVQQTTATNIAKRNDAVSITPGATGNKPDPSQFSSSIDYLRSLKN